MKRLTAAGILVTLLCLSLLYLSGCESADENTVQLEEISHYTIAPSAVISPAEFDTLYTLGTVSDADHLSNGNIAVLDRMSACACVFSPEGEFICRAGRRGSGPGEFNSPDALVPLGTDEMLIFDRSIRKISLYSNSGAFIRDVDSEIGAVFPYWTKYSGENSFTGGFMFMNGGDGVYEIEYSICSYGIDLSPADTFFTNNAQLIPGDLTGMMQNSVFSCAFSSDAAGNTFVAPVSTEEYIITGYNSSGECFLQIDRETSPVRKTDEELACETERFNTMYSARSSGEPVDYSPIDCRYAIPPQGLHCDNKGRLWVLNGQADRFLFEVYDYTGVLLFDMEVTGIAPEETISSGMMWWNLSEHGLLGFSLDPVNIPEIYVFELPE